GPAQRVVRRVVQAASAINGEVRPMAAALRPEVSLLVADRRAGDVVVFSPRGPLTRSELELVQAAGDPLALAALLPPRPVQVGDRWAVDNAAARALSSYDALAVNKLEATLESLDETSARIGLSGEVRGTVLGGEGTIACHGSLMFDRKAGRIARLTLSRAESRKPGAVEAGLDLKSTLTVERRGAETPAELSDGALTGLALEPDPDRELLVLIAPGGKYTLLHDRNWHTYWDDVRLTVLKRLDRGTVVAQCNLTVGPNAGKGRHQDLGQFRDDIRRALGSRFGAFVGEGEVEGDPGGGFRYKVGVQGREGKVGVLWNYFLVAGPEGDQLLATFTLVADQARAFGDQDLRMIGSLRWRDAPEPAAKP
ncbi:MAG TPA: hypothetical protein VKP69_09580, partial [Isosphaeraceae bacterium]|nr:hypothetical protein [Isosphaeraceae bacterium]